MRPGVDYDVWESYGKSRPDPDAYTTYCKRCWGSQGGGPGSDDDVDSASDPEVLAEDDEETPARGDEPGKP